MGFWRLINLKRLDLSDNNLTRIEGLEGLTNLEALILLGNVLIRNEEVRELQELLPHCEILFD